ncbi:KxYKxGKxW signal peptide domain-containing protein [Limosilactobacillus oris]|uniref:KxYKxGKxW signal peptide domain-containing protein n=1 Tax=Limosilactobacillus oris TaxID=1632 RepID=UPI0021B31C89|nr:KxYKxGKxW signal peptide domain-containing protein [Limosilactobacillus oris]UXC67019.1 KxYKxGKxW signal peptide domain-containing protein [Limosilactobacillus oris]
MTKEHKKLYKKGKLWLTATILALAWGIAAGGGTAAADTNNNQPAVTATVNQPAAGAASNLSTPANNQTAPTPSTNYDHQDQGNYASLDSVKLNNLGEVEVSGWHATNASVDRPNHWLIAYDQTTHTELNRVQVKTPDDRPDVTKVHNVYNANQSGFHGQIELGADPIARGDTISIISRYSRDAAGNQDYVDYWFSPFALDHRNVAWLDRVALADGQLTLAGWHASNQAANKPTHYIIILDSSDHNREIKRVQVDPCKRPDLARVYPGIMKAGQSGFQAQIALPNDVIARGDTLTIISRYSSSADGNSDYVDYWFNPVALGQQNAASLDGVCVAKGQLQLTGWHATNSQVGRPNHWLIVLDRTSGQEIGRVKVATAVARPDVAKVYPLVNNAGQAGFAVQLSTAKMNFSHQLQVISRYSASADGNSDYIDYWFNPISGNETNQGYLDSFDLSDGHSLRVAGWHANDISRLESNHYLILFDNTASRQVAVTMAKTANRPDIARLLPNLATSGQAGFNGAFDLTGVQLPAGHSYSVVSRYSTSADPNGNGGDGQYTDYWFAPVTLDRQGSWLDNIRMSKDGLHVAGWMVAAGHSSRPYAYAIVMNNGKEVARQRLTLQARPDIQKLYQTTFGSLYSGFNDVVSLDPAAVNGNLQVILRFTDDNGGNGNAVDQWSSNYSANAGNFDTITVNSNGMYVSGWHAANASVNQKYQYLIFVDAQNGQELYRISVPDANRARADVGRAFPAIYNSDHSGFQIGFTIPDQMQHHVVRIIHRYSNDAGGNGQCTDYWSGPVDVNSYAQRLIAAWSQIINNFGAPVDIAIQMPATGQVISWTNAPNHQFITASSVKVSILSLLLHNTGGNLNGYQQDLAQRMIRYSDNNATSTITASYLGGNAGVNNIFHALGMNSSYTGEHWGWTLTTASDQLKLLNEIFLKPHSDYLNDGSRNYIKYLMNTVSPAQNWGISAGSGNFYIKDGWNYIDNPYAWNVSSIGYIPDKYTIAIYTEGRPLANARTVIEQLARVTRSIVG